jgi:hypothetical protein
MLLSVVALVAGLPLAPVLAADTVVQLTPATQTIAVTQTTTVTLQVQNVTDLYGYQVEIAFDPAVVEVVDKDSAETGVQAVLGSFLKPDFVFRNEADNAAGTFTAAVSQLAPSSAVSGSGTLLTLTFRGKADGTGSIRITSLMLANIDGEVISTSQQNAQVQVSSGVTPPVTGTQLVLRNGSTGTGGPTVVEVWAEDIENFYSVDFTLAYSPAILQGVSVMPGSAFTDYDDQCTIAEKSIGGGLVEFAAEMICIVQSGDLQLAVITFDTQSCGTSPLTWEATELLDNHDDPIPHTAVNSSIVPQGCAAGATGQALMEGRTNHSGIEVSLDGTSESVLTDADGTYEFTNVFAGTYDVMMSHDLYLSAELQGCVIEGDTVDALPDVTLLGGDLNGDDVIDISDLTICGANYNTSGAAADVNGSGYVDIYDLVLIGINFGATGPTIHSCNP